MPDNPAPQDDSLFFELFDASPFPAVVSRLRDHIVLAINQRTSHVFGIAHEDAIGKHAPDYYVNPTERLMLAEQVRLHGRAENLRFQLKRPGGDTFWASVSSRRVTFAGEPAILTVFSDITEQVEAERMLKASEERLVSQSNALTELTARHVDSSGGFEERLRGILRASARTLEGGAHRAVAHGRGLPQHRVRQPASADPRR